MLVLARVANELCVAGLTLIIMNNLATYSLHLEQCDFQTCSRHSSKVVDDTHHMLTGIATVYM